MRNASVEMPGLARIDPWLGCAPDGEHHPDGEAEPKHRLVLDLDAAVEDGGGVAHLHLRQLADLVAALQLEVTAVVRVVPRRKRQLRVSAVGQQL